MTDHTIRTTTNAMATIASPAVPGAVGVARGQVKESRDHLVIFSPHGTNYELHLVAPSYSGPIASVTEGLVRVTARKVWTVPSGGNFIAPIFGTPRTIQGRVRALDERTLVVQAGTPVVVDLPDDPTAFELFVCGDNRPDSLDSRTFGSIKADQVVGKLVIRVFPIGHMKKF